ncbi:MAG TPA: cytidylate kinase family protein, partial [Bryobacteraceae bacterium]|nr:cytidylate kinase family protein [Bryobacteraceae bacterium]
ITFSGAPGCRTGELGRAVARSLRFEYLNEALLERAVAEEFKPSAAIPDKAWPYVIGSAVARLATEHHLVVTAPGSELLFADMPGLLKVHLTASDNRRIGNMMIEHRLDRATAKTALAELDAAERDLKRCRFGRAAFRAQQFDVVLNEDSLEPEQMCSIVEATAAAKHIRDEGLLSASAEARLQFKFRLQLSKHGISPPGKVKLTRVQFGHPSEEIFANLLDFYRIEWQYEARSFPIQWDKDGKVLEAFTPDFYLPEFDLYVELTTMKQEHVTKKNRKIKLLRTIYPHVNIQVFYQKDFQNLIFKHGLHEGALAGTRG